jgi:hypothetical protein
MTNAIERIVDTYVALNDRKALEELLAHRQKLILGLESDPGTITGRTVREISSEILVIKSGLTRLSK